MKTSRKHMSKEKVQNQVSEKEESTNSNNCAITDRVEQLWELRIDLRGFANTTSGH